MSSSNINRRRFLQSALATGLLYGTGSLPKLGNSALAAPLENRILVNLNLGGGPDFRHLIVPAYSSNTNSFGNKYWNYRWRSHRLNSNASSWQARWNNDYYPITVGGSGWSSGLVDAGGLNSGVTFGIWREAGWLIDMFRSGNAALVFNAVGGTNRAHDLSTLMLDQGNVLSGLNNRDRSGWGGRLARSAGGNSISLTSTPSAFCFGPLGNAPGYNPNAIDNRDLVSVQNSREIGLFDFNLENNQFYQRADKVARASKSYYAGLRDEDLPNAYDKFMDHESKVREFGELIQARLETIPIPLLIQALYRGVDIGGQPINPEPDSNNNNFGNARRVLRNSYSFGAQIRNLYDVIMANDLLDARVMSMSYGGWDSHGNQREVPAVLATDPNNPNARRGIENGLRDIFGGQFGGTPFDSNALHGGFSALWQSLLQPDRDKIVLTVAGEFGRQIRANGDAGTDHGKGNLMLVISEQCAGGVYGEMFPDDEIDKYDDTSLRTPDIDPRTEIDPLFAQVANWVQPNSGDAVFPRTASGYSGISPIIESPGLFSNLFS